MHGYPKVTIFNILILQTFVSHLNTFCYLGTILRHKIACRHGYLVIKLLRLIFLIHFLLLAGPVTVQAFLESPGIEYGTITHYSFE